MTYNYLKTMGANAIGWCNLTYQANVHIAGESFRVWASFAIAAGVGILTGIKIWRDLTKK